jgi:hypothetical protein
MQHTNESITARAWLSTTQYSTVRYSSGGTMSHHQRHLQGICQLHPEGEVLGQHGHRALQGLHCPMQLACGCPRTPQVVVQAASEVGGAGQVGEQAVAPPQAGVEVQGTAPLGGWAQAGGDGLQVRCCCCAAGVVPSEASVDSRHVVGELHEQHAGHCCTAIRMYLRAWQ